MLVWLTRTTHCRGFGIQSPNDYWFACNVVNDHKAYKEYERLSSTHRCTNPIEQKLHRLNFRIARWLKPQVCLNCTSESDIRATYIAAGNPETKVINTPCDRNKATITEAINNTGSVDMACLSTETISMDDIEKIMKKCNQHSVMIAEGIKRNKTCRDKWKKIVNSESTGITFDLYYCGIAFFDTSRYKQNYIINF